MKTPDEIKKDALALIRQTDASYRQLSKVLCDKENATLEEVLQAASQVKAELDAVKRKRDAAVKDLKAASKLLWSDDSMQCCKFCVHENDPKDTGYCDKCANGNRFEFKPAVLCPENTEVQEDDRPQDCRHA